MRHDVLDVELEQRLGRDLSCAKLNMAEFFFAEVANHALPGAK